MSNPLLQTFNTPFETAPFSKIKTSLFKPAFLELIKTTKLEIKAITNNTEIPSFENTIEALEYSGQQLDRVSSIFFNLNSAETSNEIQKIAQEISPKLTALSNDITLNKKLFKRVKYLFEHINSLNLNAEQQMLLTKKYKSFVRNGANLNIADKQKLREIDTKLAQLKLKFGENVLAETNAFELHITQKSKLKGLPEDVIYAAKIAAEQRNKPGFVFTLDFPSYMPFMMYAENRSLRKKMALAYGSRAFQNNSNNNQQIVTEIAVLRQKRAKLLGFNSHAHYVLEERMAETPQTVSDFLNDLLIKAKPAALKEFDKLANLAKKDGVLKLQKWDSAYYSEKLKKQEFNFDEELLKPYFKLENVINGAFEIAQLLFDLQFEEINNIDKYHNDVKTYKITNSKGEYIAILYADFFPRKGKRNGAWMTSFKNQWIRNGENSRPHISIVCNFTKPTPQKPSLLTFNEVTTLFHEFGHALHGMLANTTYPSLSGTNVYWDFVELPSQIMENWCYEKEALNLFAKHYETNELIPQNLIEKIKAASNFLEGMKSLRQLSFGILDMNWHATPLPKKINVKNFEKRAFKETDLFPDSSKNCMSTSFSHIFQGGYASGYYSYKWAEVLDADAFAYFKETGIFNKATASKFKTHILEKGGTEKPMELYKKFRGKKPTNEALLKRAGLI
jgi:peptidyl-dipeptidase Dcp